MRSASVPLCASGLLVQSECRAVKNTAGIERSKAKKLLKSILTLESSPPDFQSGFVAANLSILTEKRCEIRTFHEAEEQKTAGDAVSIFAFTFAVRTFL